MTGTETNPIADALFAIIDRDTEVWRLRERPEVAGAVENAQRDTPRLVRVVEDLLALHAPWNGRCIVCRDAEGDFLPLDCCEARQIVARELTGQPATATTGDQQ